jgi:hypothetical protein
MWLFGVASFFLSGFWTPLFLFVFFVTVGGQPFGFRRPSWFLNLPITAVFAQLPQHLRIYSIYLQQ